MNYRLKKGNELEGNLEIRAIKESVYEPIDDTLTIHINGDPKGLKSLAEYLLYLANLNQDEINDKDLPIGAREHGILIPNKELSRTSHETIVGRLDKKGSGQFPDWFISKQSDKPT